MGATDLVINIASQFLGKKSFGDAEKATKKLQGSVKSLGRTLGITFSAAAILAYSKASVKAASEDIKAQALLANSLKNVGLAYASVDVETFIGKMQKQTGVLDDVLRPAFANLAGVTGSVTMTEKIMGVAFDASSGSGLDYAATIDILSKAYIGNRKGLKELKLGLTDAEIKSKSFDELMQIIADRFAGAGAAAINTYAGQMSLLSASASDASEIIGVSLLGAIDSLAGSDGIANVGTDITNAAKSLANFIDSVVYLKEQIATIPGAGIVKGVFGLLGNVLGRFSPQRAAELLKEIKGPQPFSQPMTLANQDKSKANLAAAKKAELDAIKRNKELAKLAKAQATAAALTAQKKKDQLALDKAALALGKGQNVFDIDAIQINAALLAKQDEINKLGASATDAQRLALATDVVRLTIKQDMLLLEDAIAAKDVAGATALAAKLNKDLAILGVLQGQNVKLLQINTILDSFKPKSLIDLDNLNEALRLLGLFKFPTLVIPKDNTPLKPGPGPSPGPSGLIPGVDYNPDQNKDRNFDNTNARRLAENADYLVQELYNEAGNRAGLGLASEFMPAGFASLDEYFKESFGNRGSGMAASSPTLNFNAPIYTVSDAEFAANVQKAIQNNNRFGNNLDYAGAI